MAFLCENVEINDRFAVNPMLRKVFFKLDFASRVLSFEFDNPAAKELVKYKLSGDFTEISQLDLTSADNSIRVELSAFNMSRYAPEAQGLMHQWRKCPLSDVADDIDDEISQISLTALLALDVTGKPIANRTEIIDRLCTYPKKCTVDGKLYSKNAVAQSTEPQKFDTGSLYCPSKNEYIPNPTLKESQEEQVQYGEERLFEESVNVKDFTAIEQEINSSQV